MDPRRKDRPWFEHSIRLANELSKMGFTIEWMQDCRLWMTRGNGLAACEPHLMGCVRRMKQRCKYLRLPMHDELSKLWLRIEEREFWLKS